MGGHTFDRAPKLDPMSGLHSQDCECPRCEAGFRPTMGQRWAAKAAHERAKARAAAVQQSDRQRARKELGAADLRARLAAEDAETAARVRELERARERARVPSDEELAELRRIHGLPPPRRKGNHHGNG